MPAPAYGCRERLQAEPDEVRSARDPDSGEHRLRRGDEGGDAGASGERPQRLADRNTLRGAETVRASPRSVFRIVSAVSGPGVQITTAASRTKGIIPGRAVCT